MAVSSRREALECAVETLEVFLARHADEACAPSQSGLPSRDHLILLSGRAPLLKFWLLERVGHWYFASYFPQLDVATS